MYIVWGKEILNFFNDAWRAPQKHLWLHEQQMNNETLLNQIFGKDSFIEIT